MQVAVREGICAFLVSSCASSAAAPPGALAARIAGAPPDAPRSGGLEHLELPEGGEAWIVGGAGDEPHPLVVLFHGAGGRAERVLDILKPLVKEHGLVVLAPQSHGITWDLLHGEVGPDAATVDAAIIEAVRRYRVDPRHVAVAGFSDGATYALALGVRNPELFTHVIAFSPGFVRAEGGRAMPSLFVSHGTQDAVLPIAPCGRTVVATLKRLGYPVRYSEFEGPHTVPPAVAREAIDWFTGARP